MSTHYWTTGVELWHTSLKEWLHVDVISHLLVEWMVVYLTHVQEVLWHDKSLTQNHISFQWLNNDSDVGHVTKGELGRRHNRFMSCLGQWVIDTMVGLDKVCCSDSFHYPCSEFLPLIYLHTNPWYTNRSTSWLHRWGDIPQCALVADKSSSHDNLGCLDMFVFESLIFELRVVLPTACTFGTSPTVCLVFGNTLRKCWTSRLPTRTSNRGHKCFFK